MGHRPLVSDNRPFLVSPGEGEQREGRAGYISKAPIETEGLLKPVNGQEGNHNRKSRSNLGPLDSSREIEHRMTHAVGCKLAIRTGELENKVSPPCRFFVLLRA